MPRNAVGSTGRCLVGNDRIDAGVLADQTGPMFSPKTVATPNGLEPSTSSVTGWRANRLHHGARCCHRKPCNAVDDFLHTTQNSIIVACYLVTLDSLLSAYVTNAPFIFPAAGVDHSAGHGAGGGTRTHTVGSPPTDFESVKSTIPSHRRIW